MVQVNCGETSVEPKAPVESNPRDSSGSSDFRGVRDVEVVAKVFQVGKRALCSPASVSPPTPTPLLSFFCCRIQYFDICHFFSILFATDQENQRYNNGLPLLRQIVVCLYFYLSHILIRFLYLILYCLGI